MPLNLHILFLPLKVKESKTELFSLYFLYSIDHIMNYCAENKLRGIESNTDEKYFVYLYRLSLTQFLSEL